MTNHCASITTITVAAAALCVAQPLGYTAFTSAVRHAEALSGQGEEVGAMCMYRSAFLLTDGVALTSEPITHARALVGYARCLMNVGRWYDAEVSLARAERLVMAATVMSERMWCEASRAMSIIDVEKLSAVAMACITSCVSPRIELYHYAALAAYLKGDLRMAMKLWLQGFERSAWDYSAAEKLAYLNYAQPFLGRMTADERLRFYSALRSIAETSSSIPAEAELLTHVLCERSKLERAFPCLCDGASASQLVARATLFDEPGVADDEWHVRLPVQCADPRAWFGPCTALESNLTCAMWHVERYRTWVAALTQKHGQRAGPDDVRAAQRIIEALAPASNALERVRIDGFSGRFVRHALQARLQVLSPYRGGGNETEALASAREAARWIQEHKELPGAGAAPERCVRLYIDMAQLARRCGDVKTARAAAEWAAGWHPHALIVTRELLPSDGSLAALRAQCQHPLARMSSAAWNALVAGTIHDLARAGADMNDVRIQDVLIETILAGLEAVVWLAPTGELGGGFWPPASVERIELLQRLRAVHNAEKLNESHYQRWRDINDGWLIVIPARREYARLTRELLHVADELQNVRGSRSLRVHVRCDASAWPACDGVWLRCNALTGSRALQRDEEARGTWWTEFDTPPGLFLLRYALYPSEQEANTCTDLSNVRRKLLTASSNAIVTVNKAVDVLCERVVRLECAVRGSTNVNRVFAHGILRTRAGTNEFAVALRDDGLNGDVAEADGVWSGHVGIPPGAVAVACLFTGSTGRPLTRTPGTMRPLALRIARDDPSTNVIRHVLTIEGEHNAAQDY